MTKRKPINQLKICTLMVCLASFISLLSAPILSAEPDMGNIGFIKTPSHKLKAKFPMCGVFLKVDWIDKNKKIGHTTYQARLFNDKGILENEKKTVSALVYLDDLSPSYTMDIYQYKRQGRMNELFDWVREGEVTSVPMHFAIKHQGKLTVFYEGISPVLGNHQQTVCIAYPDQKRAWIVESKTVKQAYSEQEQKILAERIGEIWKLIPKEILERFWVLDVNFDGKDDFVFSGIDSGVIVYSRGDKLYAKQHSVENFNYKLTFPPDNRTCQLKFDGRFSLTTDGTEYFIRNQCNLTKLTSTSEKE